MRKHLLFASTWITPIETIYQKNHVWPLQYFTLIERHNWIIHRFYFRFTEVKYLHGRWKHGLSYCSESKKNRRRIIGCIKGKPRTSPYFVSSYTTQTHTHLLSSGERFSTRWLWFMNEVPHRANSPPSRPKTISWHTLKFYSTPFDIAGSVQTHLVE